MNKTLALAAQLGLARYRKLDGSTSNNINREKSGQENLQFLFVLDFESTCWEEKSSSPPPEIIEFPVVLLSMRTGEILSEFHHYCLPIEYPRLSPFCKNLTGKLLSKYNFHVMSLQELRKVKLMTDCPWAPA